MGHRWQGDKGYDSGKPYLPFQTSGKTINTDDLESRHLITEPTAIRDIMRENQHDHECWMLLHFSAEYYEKEEL